MNDEYEMRRSVYKLPLSGQRSKGVVIGRRPPVPGINVSRHHHPRQSDQSSSYHFIVITIIVIIITSTLAIITTINNISTSNTCPNGEGRHIFSRLAWFLSIVRLFGFICRSSGDIWWNISIFPGCTKLTPTFPEMIRFICLQSRFSWLLYKTRIDMGF